MAQTEKPKAYCVMFVRAGQENLRFPEEYELVPVDVPMTKYSQLENSDLVERLGQLNVIRGHIEKWCNTAKEVLKTRFELPGVEQAIVYDGAKNYDLVISGKKRPYYKAELLEQFVPPELLEKCRVETEYVEFRVNKRKEP
jgi:hypothetical protein